MQLRFLKDLGMNSRHTVYGETVVDIHMGHMDPLILVDDLYLGILIFCLDPFIKLVDNRNQLRHHLLQISIRPFFQGFCQNRMVCVGTGFAHHFNRFIYGKGFLLHQDTDQFRDDHGRVRVINLDYRMLIQLAQIIMLLPHLLQNELGRIAHHKILLVNTQ